MGTTLGTTLGTSLVSASIIMATASAGWASGFYLQDQSARGTGRAYSGEAADQGPDSLWWNPASIAGSTHSEIDSNVVGILIWSKATDTGSTIDRFGAISPVGGTRSTSGVVSNGVLPSAAVALRLNDQWALGFALTSPFSFTTKYDNASFARYAALTSRLQTIDVQPSLAWRPASWLGLGAGVNIEQTAASLSSSLPNLSRQRVTAARPCTAPASTSATIWVCNCISSMIAWFSALPTAPGCIIRSAGSSM